MSRWASEAPPEIPNHIGNHASGIGATHHAKGMATHRPTQCGQSINWPRTPLPARVRSRTMTSNGPSSRATRCATRQVANTAITNRNQSVMNKNNHEDTKELR